MFFYGNTYENLDLDYIVNKVKTSSIYGRDLKINTNPYFDKKELNNEFDYLTDVLNSLLKNKYKFTKVRNILKQMKEIRGTLKRLDDKQILSEVELFELKNFSLEVKKINSVITTSLELPEVIIPQQMTEVEKLLDPRMEGLPTYYIYDEYSSDLKSIRKRINDIEKVLLNEKKDLYTNLSDKYDIKIRPNGQVKISKESDSYKMIKESNDFVYVSEEFGMEQYKVDDSKFFKELTESINIDKNLQEIEEEKIKLYLSSVLSLYIDEFVENINKISHLDVLIGKASFAMAYNLVRPIISGNNIDIKAGVNIPVVDRLKKEKLEFTPIDVSVGKGATIITGSNMGGKTVSLKLIGQIVSMAQLGLFVPAIKAEMPLREFIYISIGDSQNIDLGLSSFAGEVVEVAKVIKKSQGKGLILIDELSRGTNPQEGFAISKSISDYLNDSNSICVFTSHYDGITEGKVHYQVKGLKNIDFKLLKLNEKAIKTLHEQMDYTLERVIDTKQVPKEAIPVAEMLGLDKKIIDKAKKIIKGNQVGGLK